MGKKVPVMLLFFTRAECLKEVFESVRNYQPEELFLVQDGPRLGRADDVENIEKCREIVENIDWPCTVHRNYAEKNMSCDPREYTGIAWCFEHVDKLIILEDDCVPTQSFFKLCEECLEKYKDNSQIHSIYGFNRVLKYKNCPYDYLFSKTSAGWGWATWKHVWNRIEELSNLEVLNNNDDVEYLQSNADANTRKIYGGFVSYMKKTKQSNEIAGYVTEWEKLVGFPIITDNMLTIVPKCNMIKYIGISDGSTHTTFDERVIPHKIKHVLLQEAYDIQREIKHPPFVVRDLEFEEKSSKSMKYLPYFANIEGLFLKIRYWGLKKTITKLRGKHGI